MMLCEAWAKMRMRSGHCLCGACRFEISGEPIIVARCHCTDCQHITGSGHSTGAMFREDGVSLAGPTASFQLKSAAGNTVTRVFCGVCGSPLFGKNSGMPQHMTVSMGALEGSDDLVPQVAIFVRSKRAWDHIADDAISFDDQPAWQPGADSK